MNSIFRRGGGGVGRKKIDPSSERRLMIVHRGLIMAIMAPSCPVPTCPNNPNRIATSTAFQSPLGQTERHRETKKKKKIKKTRVVKGKKTSQQSLNGVDRKIFLFFKLHRVGFCSRHGLFHCADFFFNVKICQW